jgi:hypothetical protein
MTWMARLVALSACISIVTIAAACAAVTDAAVPPVLAKIIASAEHRKAVIEAAQQSSAWLNNRCGRATFAITPDVAIYQAPELDAQARPTAGAWRERIIATGCGASRTLNVLKFVKSPGSLVSGTLLPGTTRADPLLQRDAFHYATVAAAAPATCGQTYVADTAFAGIEGAANASLPPGRRYPPWKEEWTVVACDRRSVVTLHFAPDATGTNITAHLNETRPAR